MADRVDDPPAGRCAVFVDLGTTNTRVWLARGGQVVARASAQVGVRDTARDGNSTRLRQTLATLIRTATDDARDKGVSEPPACVIAAGMITSSLGLADVPHLPAPAGIAELAAATRGYDFPDVTPLPVLLVPGVRTGALSTDPRAACGADLMRGEETLCAGLVAVGLARSPGVVLNLGSHWKAVQLDTTGRVAGSVTSLTGEVVHAVQTQTILASAVPQGRPDALDPEWINAGMAEQRRSGLGRALFCVRLLEQAGASAEADALDGGARAARRMAFLVGAFVAADLDALTSRGVVGTETPVTVVGGAALAGAWREALQAVGVRATVVTESQTEQALLAGLRRILDANGASGSPPKG